MKIEHTPLQAAGSPRADIFGEIKGEVMETKSVALIAAIAVALSIGINVIA